MAKNNTIINKNIQSLCDKYRSYTLKDYDKKQEGFNIEVFDAKDNYKTMRLINKKKSVFLHSKYAPFREAIRWTDQLNIKKDSVIVIFGLGLGYHIREIIERMTNDNILIVIEPSIAVFNKAISTVDLCDIFNNDRVNLIIGSEWDQFKRMLDSKMNLYCIENLIVKDFFNYKNAFPNEYSKFIDTINESVRLKKMYRNTISYFSKTWQENLFKNIPFVLDSQDVSDFFGKFNNYPIIIVSAGPSLNKNVKILKEVKDRAVIICVGTALKVLHKHRIKPHFIVVVDGGEISFKHFEGINYSDVPLVYSNKVYPAIPGNHKGDKISFYIDDGFMHNILDDISISMSALKSGGSVSNTAVDFAVRMGGNPIILMGQDLAYTDGKTHAEGTIFERDEIQSSDNLIKIKDINGDEVYTSHKFMSLLNWFNDYIKSDKSQRIYINATEGGIKIEEAIALSLEEALDKYCLKSFNISEKINEVLRPKTHFFEKKIEVKLKLKSNLESLLNLKFDIEKGLKLMSSTNKTVLTENQEAVILSNIQHFNAKIKAQIDRLNIIHYIIQPIFEKHMNSYIDNNATTKKIIDRFQSIYGDINKAVTYTIKLIEDSLDTLA